MQGWKDTQKQEFEFLDSKDLRPYIKNYKYVDELFDKVLDDLNKEYLKQCKIPDEELFNWISEDEFLTYICNRYNLTFYEQTRYYLYTQNFEYSNVCENCEFYHKDVESCFAHGPEFERHSPSSKACDDFKFKEENK